MKAPAFIAYIFCNYALFVESIAHKQRIPDKILLIKGAVLCQEDRIALLPHIDTVMYEDAVTYNMPGTVCPDVCIGHITLLFCGTARAQE